MRRETILNENWLFIKDGRSLNVDIPHTWNAIDGQDGGNDYYRGKCVYSKSFPDPRLSSDEHLYLEFCGVNSSAEVFLNGERIASHDGGYSAFNVRIDQKLREENDIVVHVDNSENDRVYPQMADFTFYGGIYREVRLVAVSSTHFDFSGHGGHGVKLGTEVLADKSGKLYATASVCGPYDKVIFSILDGQNVVVSAEGAYCVAVVPSVHIWDGLEDPFLYTVRADVFHGGVVVDSLEYKVGFRTFEFDSMKGFMLNGRSYPLRGVSRHQDRVGIGNALTKSMHEEDMKLILEVGANSIRLAHYQHDQFFYDLCDRLGVIVWAEIPYITKHMPNGFDNTVNQMTELIEQCSNHTSIACWGISNEITAGGNSEAVYENNKTLYELCHRLDSRPVSMAHAFMLPIHDKMVDLPDIAGYNLYYGWYLGDMDGNGSFLDSCHEAHPGLPLGLTEFGCDANINLQTSNPRMGDYSEQYQALFHERMCSEIAKRTYLWGTYIWNMFDFAADARDEGGSKGKNCKGLVTFDRKFRKDAFYAVKSWYSKEPFVHICSKRYVKRCEEETMIRIYSNQAEVELLVNGRSLGKKTGEHVFEFRIPLSGDLKIVARSGGLSDSSVIEKVSKPEESYVLRNVSDVSNWFSGLKLKTVEGMLCINDSMGLVMKSDKGFSLVKQIMESRKGNKGEGVASQVVMPDEMLRLALKDIKFSELLRKGRVSEAKIIEINDILCTIPREDL